MMHESAASLRNQTHRNLIPWRMVAIGLKWNVMIAMAVLVMISRPLSAADLLLINDKSTDYQVVLPDQSATPGVANALQQTANLVQAVWKSNGVAIAIVPEAQRDATKPGIYLGDTNFARSHGVDVKKLSGWSYVQKVVGRDVIIAGIDQPSPGKAVNKETPAYHRLATAKGVTDFLRQYAGARFLYPDVVNWGEIATTKKFDFSKNPAFEFLPKSTIAIADNLNVTVTPVLKSNIGWAQGYGFYDIANNRFPAVDDIGGCHTYHRAIPPEKYLPDHPEYFAMLGGKRVSDFSNSMPQYCISNPEVQELLYKDMIFWLENGYDSVDIGQSDGFRPCQCENCAKLFNTGQDWGEKLWILHRNLAQRVYEKYPDRTVNLSSYSLTERPPKTFNEFPKNVRIMLCGTNDDDFEAWKNCKVPRGFTSYIYNSCPNLGTRFTPMRTPRYVEAQAKRFVKNHVQSIYRDGNGMLFGLEGPVYYTMGRMFDDAQNNQARELVQEFCGAAFGKSAPAMLRFYDQLYHDIELYSEYLGTRDPAWSYKDIYGRGRKYLTDPFQFIAFFYTPNLLASLETELAAAEKTADGDRVKARLQLVRREFDYIKHLARVVHLYHAYQVQPDATSRDRLLDAIDARNALINSWFGEKNMSLPMPGWSQTFFPYPGYSADHLRLNYDGYQEPYKNTCFNWDTKAMRLAALPGTKRFAIKPAMGVVKVDSPLWDRAASDALASIPMNTRQSLQTSVRMLSDAENLYVRVESELAAEAMRTVLPQESLEIYVTPAGKEISYKFKVGPMADSKSDAASGFITDVMDPRYGQYDPDWSGEWTYETKLDPDKNRWFALLKIPFKTLGVTTPPTGTVWRANVGRNHPTGSKSAEVSLWSSNSNTKMMEDRSAFGEIIFEAAGATADKSAPKKTDLQKLREDYNVKTGGEIPADWKKLTALLPTPLGPWLFHADPVEQGLKEKWFALDANTADWTPIKVPGYWDETDGVGEVIGYGWYRTTFTLPADWKGRPLRLLFAGADEQAWIYVNGKFLREHTEKSEGKSFNELWEEPFTAEIPSDILLDGKPNVLAVRVYNSIKAGGLWRPVLIQQIEKK